jgi:dihydrolipoamide dehydrogenase
MKRNSMEKKVLVIGGGPGGYPAALILAQRGAKVTLVEKDELGGTCLNRGCIPTKVLLHASNLMREVKKGDRFGLVASDVRMDFPRLNKHKAEVVETLANGVKSLCEARRIRVIKGTAFFEAPRKIRIKETKEEVEGDAVIISTGSLPAIIPIKGTDHGRVVTSDQALSFKRVPSSIVIIGGGYIGLEFAQIFHTLGSKVTVLEMLNQILPNEDADIAGELGGILKADGIKIVTGANVKEISEKTGKGFVHYLTEGRDHSVEAESVLMAVGRRPNTKDLGLEKNGVRTENGKLVVNDKMETSASNVYAVGDAVGGVMLAHKATAEGRIAACNILGESQRMDYTAIPRCIYTYPEAACVGLTEAQAKERYGEVLVGRVPFQASGKARIIDGMGFAKVVTEKKYGRIVGVHLVGPHVTDLIAEVALGMNLECTHEELAFTIHPHPTLSEVLMEAAMAAQGYKIHSV